jgi:glutamate dehydrogenase
VIAGTAARDSFALQEINGEIDALDNAVPGALQLDLYREVQDVLLDRLGWFLRNVDMSPGIGAVVGHYRASLEALNELLLGALPDDMARGVRDKERRLRAARVPAELAQRLARLPVIARASDVVLIAERCGRPLADAARAYYAVADRFRFDRIDIMVRAVETGDYYESVALGKARDNLAAAHRRLGESVLSADSGAPDIARWEAGFGREVAATAERIEAILLDGRPTAAKATVAASLLAELAGRDERAG